MSADEWEDQIEALLNLNTLLIPDGSEQYEAAAAALDEAVDQIKDLLAKANDTDPAKVTEYIKALQQAVFQEQKAILLVEQAMLVQKGYQKVKTIVAGANDKVASISVGLASKIKKYLKKNDISEIVVPDEEDIVDFSQMSDEELKAYFDNIRGSLVEYFEEMKINIPELRMMDANEIAGMITKTVIQVYQNEKVQAAITTIAKVKQKAADYKIKITTSYKSVLEFFFVDLPWQLEENTDEPEAEPVEEPAAGGKISEALAEKIGQLIVKAMEQLNKDVDAYNAKAEEINANIDAIEANLEMISNKSQEAVNSIDWEGLAMYAYISDMVKNDTWGFDMFRTADGENFEVVTNDGFGDPYNYGGRSMVATEYGLYLGTANPFYGAQLYRLNDQFVNNSSVSATDVSVGTKVTITGAAEGGSGEFLYTYQIKKPGKTSWTTLGEKYTDATSKEFTAKLSGEYEVRVLVKDSAGFVISFKTTVTSTGTLLVNKSTISTTSAVLSDSVTLNAVAEEGTAPYRYTYELKKPGETKFKTVGKRGSSNESASFTAYTAGTYEAKVYIQDASNYVTVKTFSVDVLAVG